MDLGIDQPPLPVPVQEDQGVPGSRPGLFQQSDADGHVQLPGQGGKGPHEIPLRRDGFLLPLCRRAVIDAVAAAPHLGEQGDVGPHFPGLPAGAETLFPVLLQRAAGLQLQERDVQHPAILFHGAFLLRAPKAQSLVS